MRIILTILLAFITNSARAGGEAGNGGDVVYCQVSTTNSFVGYYALDYLLTMSSSRDEDIVEIKNWWDHSDWFRRVFNPNQNGINMSSYHDAYDDFYFDTYNFQDYLRPHIWIESYFELIDIKDEGIFKKIPENCLSRNSSGQPQIIQAVIREKRQKITVFHYDRNILETLKNSYPLQYSFLLAHEWLWQFTNKPQIIRETNRFLHSKKAGQFQGDKLDEYLSHIGLVRY